MAFEFPFGSGDKDGVDGHHEYLEVVKLAMWGYVELYKELESSLPLRRCRSMSFNLVELQFRHLYSI